jgi:2-dehydropantoate 2-reductase
MENKPRIMIAGAGSIGSFVGGLLLASGRNVSFLGREHVAAELSTSGLTLSDYTGMKTVIGPEQIVVKTDPACLCEADVILVCVKGGATRTMGELVAEHAKPEAVVVSLQNGIRNAEILATILPDQDVRAGMVPFNVIKLAPGTFHRATSGDMVVEAGTPDIAGLLNVANLKTSASSEMEAILRGKLLLNLNNALNAISDMPLLDQLNQRSWRVRMAQQIDEALAVFKAEGITPIPPSPVPAWVLPHILRLPTPLFKRVAKRMLEIDPTARASMWEDLRQGKKTEINDLQGEVVRLAEQFGLASPHNRQTLEEIRAVEQQG